MKTEQSLFAYTKQKMFEKSKINYTDLEKILHEEGLIEHWAEDLAAYAKPLWRYSKNAAPFTKEQWENTIKKSWLGKGDFPVLYREACVYDKREVVACILLFLDPEFHREDELISILSSGNTSYDGRPLYQLHYKEGLFRLVLQWNRSHKPYISFAQAIGLYEQYETAVLEHLKKQWSDMQAEFERVFGLQNDSPDYRQAVHYYSLCEDLWVESEKWSLPLQLIQQDELQRLIVLMAHVKRSIGDLLSDNRSGMLTRNRITRRDMERGTAYCEELLKRCCKKDRWEDAVGLYIDQGLSAIGEACWQAVSKMLKVYSECGKYAEDYSAYVASPVRSVRNKQAKQYCKVPICYEDAPKDVNCMSFSVDVEEVRRRIMEQSANTMMIAQLLQPEYRKDRALFARQGTLVQQSALSLFLRSYYLWCEGKTKRKSQGVERIPLPFYDFKRNMVIKYALACGCSSCAELEAYLKFTGYAKLNMDHASEKTVFLALEWYGKLSYEQKKQTSPIEVILLMQRYYLYHLAVQCQSRYGLTVNESVLRRYVHKFQKGCLYKSEFPEFSVKNDAIGKQGSIEAYDSVWFLLMLLLRCISMNVRSQEKGTTLAKEILQMIFEKREPFETEYPSGFLMYVSEPEKMAEEYLESLSDCCDWQEKFQLTETINMEEISQIMAMLSGHLSILSKIKCSNSSELEFLYEVWFYVMSVVKEYCDVSENGEYLSEYRKILEQLQNAVIIWTFSVGCKNFSLSSYEQRLGFNHFAKKHHEVDYSQGNRWLRYVHDLREDQKIWNEIVSDLHTLCKCREYIERHQLMNHEEMDQMLAPMEGHLEECRETLRGILSHLQKKEGDGNLIRQLSYVYNQIHI